MPKTKTATSKPKPAKTRPKTVKFEPSARIQGLLGRELISSDYVAIAESVRNAYDAGAQIVTITLQADSPQKIIISDNGSGMSFEEFQKSWMSPGYSEKKTISTRQNGRPALGEKGIGRFAVDKLASKLRVVTKKKSNPKAISIDFDWSKFENQNEKLNKIRIPISDVFDEKLIEQGQGTRLELTSLRKTWEEKDWLDLRNELKKLISPSETKKPKNFKIIANCKAWKSGDIVPDFHPAGSYHYSFSINKVGRIFWSLTRPDNIIQKLKDQNFNVKKTENGFETISNTFGFAYGNFYFFDNAQSIKKQKYDYGVGIYRDGFRVEPYGRLNNDWIEIKSLRAKRQGHAPVSPSKLFGFIDISRQDNPELKDLTNREGIQESMVFKDFRESIIKRFLHFAGFIAEDNDKMPLSPTIAGQKLSVSRLTKGRTLADVSNQLAHQLRQPMNHISLYMTALEKHIAKNIGETHEVQEYFEKIQSNIDRLNSNIDSISDLAKDLKQPTSEIDLPSLLTDLYNRHKPNFDHHRITFNLVSDLPSAKAKFSEAALNFAVENYLNNAFNATLSATKSTRREVILRLAKAAGGNIRISVEDFGDGVPSTQADMVFHNTVPSKNGTGFGLYFTKIRIEEFNGTVGFERISETTSFYVEIED